MTKEHGSEINGIDIMNEQKEGNIMNEQKEGIGYYHRISGYDVFTQSWKGFSTVERTNVQFRGNPNWKDNLLPNSDLVLLRWYKNPDKPSIHEITKEMVISEVFDISSKGPFSFTEIMTNYSRLIIKKGTTLTAVLESHLPDDPDYDKDLRYLRIIVEPNPLVVYFGGERPPSIGDD